jgi:hypothetical protein
MNTNNTTTELKALVHRIPQTNRFGRDTGHAKWAVSVELIGARSSKMWFYHTRRDAVEFIEQKLQQGAAIIDGTITW